MVSGVALVTWGASAGGCSASSSSPAPAETAPADTETGDEARAPQGHAPAGPVLVELFTSQGCSSCPPADALLSQLGRRGSLEGVAIVPLSFHVDYWNYIGWRDPFSSPAWTGRQKAYAEKLSKGRLYTPQLIIAGRAHAVGSRRGPIASALAGLGQRKAAPLSASMTTTRDAVTVRIRGASPSKTSHVWVALYENGIETRVPRGENAGQTLKNDYVVRALSRAPSPTGGESIVRFALNAAWSSAQLGAVAFVQDRQSLAIDRVARAQRSDGAAP